MSKLSYVEVFQELSKTSAACLQSKNSYSHVCGLYEAMLGQMLADLPAARQADAMRALKTFRQRLEETA